MSTASSFTAFKGEHVTLDGTPPTATDVTGWTFEVNCRKLLTDAVPLFTLTVTATANGQILINDVTTGDIAIILTATATTTAMGAGTFYLDLWRTDVSTEKPLAIITLTLLATPRTGS